MALKDGRPVSEKQVPHAPEFGHGVAKGYRVYRGSIVAVCADGTIVPAGTTGTPSPVVAIVGLARQFKDNSPAGSVLNGSMVGPDPIWVKKGCYALPFSETQPTWANVGQPVYAVDDEFVSLSGGSTSAPAAGEGSASSPAAPTRLQVGTLAGFELDGTPYTLIV